MPFSFTFTSGLEGVVRRRPTSVQSTINRAVHPPQAAIPSMLCVCGVMLGESFLPIMGDVFSWSFVGPTSTEAAFLAAFLAAFPAAVPCAYMAYIVVTTA